MIMIMYSHNMNKGEAMRKTKKESRKEKEAKMEEILMQITRLEVDKCIPRKDSEYDKVDCRVFDLTLEIAEKYNNKDLRNDYCYKEFLMDADVQMLGALFLKRDELNEAYEPSIEEERIAIIDEKIKQLRAKYTEYEESIGSITIFGKRIKIW